MLNRGTVLSIVLLLAGAAAANAQPVTTAPHSGFWLSGGIGVGTSDTDVGDDAGPAGYLRLGGTLSEHFLLGGEVIGFGRDAGSADISQGNATAVLLYYPSSPGGLFAKAGVGFASVSVSQSVGGGIFTADDQGFGLTLGGGFDLRLGRNLFLTPNVDVLLQSFDDFADASVFLFTLGIGFH